MKDLLELTVGFVQPNKLKDEENFSYDEEDEFTYALAA
jgi:hypothetical protein